MWNATGEVRDRRERRDAERLGFHLAWPVTLIPPVSHLTHQRPWMLGDFLSFLPV